MGLGHFDRWRGLYGRVVGAEAAGASRRVGRGSGRGQLARRGGDKLLSTAQGRQRRQGIGSVVGRGRGRGRGQVGDGLAALTASVVVEEGVDAAHCLKQSLQM